MDAFRGDTFICTTLGGQESNPDLYYRFFRAHVLGTLVDGELWVAEDFYQDTPNSGEEGKKKIVGVALWFPPGKEFLGSEEQRKAAGMDSVIRDMGESMERWWYDYYIPKNGAQAAAALGGPTARRDACYMFVLTVLPSHHNKGLGRSLLLTRAKAAWAEGQRVCWEAGNEPNVAKYQKWGGRALSRERYEGDADGRWLEMWIMEMPNPDSEAGKQ